MDRPPPPLLSLPPLSDDLGKQLEDALCVSVGFAVLAFQQAQVRRRQLERQLRRTWHDLQARNTES